MVHRCPVGDGTVESGLQETLVQRLSDGVGQQHLDVGLLGFLLLAGAG